MAIHLSCFVPKPREVAKHIVAQLLSRHAGLFEYRFLISEVYDTNEIENETAGEYGFAARCIFSIRLNDKSCADILPAVEDVVKFALGPGNVLILFNSEILR
ncbi:hypothetical protein ACK9YZ_21935 [Rhizobium sp. ZK1]|uniref:hypothetical protein n=1 Tax=Rhizobium sp. ZK1 TaxID=3389872 RepID=UPI0039F6B4D7